MWTGKIHNQDFVADLLTDLANEPNRYGTEKLLLGKLSMIHEVRHLFFLFSFFFLGNGDFCFFNPQFCVFSRNFLISRCTLIRGRPSRLCIVKLYPASSSGW
jgi:hypothetical protein